MNLPNTDGIRRFVSVPVPEEYAVQVMSYVAELDAQAVAGPAAGPAAESTDDGAPLAATRPTDARVAAWPTEDLAQLARGGNFSIKVLGEVMDVLADQPGQWRNLTELAEATSRERAEVKGIWTHVGRHMKSRYNGRSWPLDAKWGPQIDPTWPGVTYYRIGAEQAKRWKEARKAAAA